LICPIAITLSLLGRLHKKQGDYAKALALYARSLKISEKALGANHLDVARHLNDLGIIYYEQRENSEVLPFL
jgi:tetratricopeptide (TPR) repeat protein